MTDFARFYLDRLLRVCVAILALAFLVVAAIQLAFPSLFLYPLALVLLVAVVITLCIRPIQRRLGDAFTLHGLVLGDLILTMVFVFFFGGLASGMSLLYVFIIVVAALLLGSRWVGVYALLTSIAFLLQVGLDLVGIRASGAPLPAEALAWSQLAMVAGFIFLVLAYVGAGVQIATRWKNEKGQVEIERAEQTALAAEKTRLLAEQKKRAAQLEIASSIAAQLSLTQDPQTLMQQVVERIGERFGYHVVGIMLIDPDARELRIAAAYGMLADRAGTPYRQSIEQGILGVVARTGKSYLATDVTRDPYYFYPVSGNDPVRSELGVPLRQSGRVTGLLDLQSTEPNAFDASDVAAMEILAEQLAVALTRSAALAQEKKRAAQLALVSEIAVRATALDEPEAMLQTMVRLVQERFGYHHVCVALLDSAHDELELRAVAGPNAPFYTIGERWKTDRGLIGIAARTRQIVVSNDVKADPRFLPDSDRGEANSELCIPLVSNHLVLGVLDIETTTRNGFSEDDMSALTTLANQIAAALDKTHALERERRRAAQLEMVNRIASRIARLSPVDQLLPDLVNMIRDQFGYYNVAVFVQQPNTNGLTLYANAGPLGALNGERVITDHGIIGHVRQSGGTYLCTDVHHDPYYSSPFPARESDPTHAELAIPLRRGPTLAGVLDIQSEKVNAFDTSDVTALQVLADQISETLENARLVEQLQARLEAQQTLTAVSRTFLETLDAESIVRACTEAARAALNVDCAIIFTPDASDRLMIRHSHGFPNELVDVRLSADATSTPGRAFQTRQAHSWGEENLQEAHPVARRAGFRAGLSVPMRVGDRVAGVVTVNSLAARHFDETDIQTLSLVANQTAIALERATYFQKQQRSAHELNLLFDSYRAASSTLEPNEVIARLLEQLTRALDVTSAYFIQVDQKQGRRSLVREYFADGAKPRERIISERTGNLADFPLLLEQLRNGPIEFHRSDPDLLPAIRRAFEEGDGQSSLRVPLWSKDELLGYFSLWESRAPRRWTAEEIRFVQTMASQVTAALSNARLYDAATTRARELQALYEASRLLNQSLDVPTICEIGVDSLHDILGYDHVSIYFVEGDRLKIQIQRGYVNVLESIPLTQGVMAYSVRTRQIAFLPEVSQEPGFLAAIPGIQSEIAVPLLHGDRVVGVLNVETIKNEQGLGQDRLTEADVQLLSTFANQLVIAIENGRLFQETQQRLAELGQLHAATRALNTELNLEAVVERVAEQFVAALEVDSFTLESWDRSRDEMEVLFDFDPEPTARVQVRERFGLAEAADYLRIMREGKPGAFREDDPDLSQGMRENLTRYRWKSVLALPLISKGQVIGLIELGDRRRLRAFSSDEVRLGESLASQAAIAIENARLYRDAQQRLYETETLYQFARDLSTTLDVQEMGERVLDAAARVTPFDIGQVCLLEEPERSLRSLVKIGQTGDPPGDSVLEGRQGVVGWVVEHGAIVRLGEVAADSRYKPLSPRIHSEIALPLRVGDRVIGVLNLEAERADAFDDRTEQLLTAFANQLAIAIENARLYEQSKRDAEVKAALLRELSHRVKNNLAAITSLLYLALDEPPEAREKILSETLGRVQSMALAHALLARSERARVNLIELGRQVLNDTVRQLADPGTQIDIQVQGDPVEIAARQTTTLALVLNELATNSLRHGFDIENPGKPSLMRFSVWRDGQAVCLELEDNGRGLPLDFDLQAATGLGLNLVRTLVEKDLHGKFEMHSEEHVTRARIRFQLEE